MLSPQILYNIFYNPIILNLLIVYAIFLQKINVIINIFLLYKCKIGVHIMLRFLNLSYKDADTLIDNHQQEYKQIDRLKGRGQAGLAAFYKKTSDPKIQILVKVDDPATCVVEGSADFVTTSHVIPTQLANTVNYAYVGSYSDENNQTHTISIQDKVVPTNSTEKVVPWDTIVYGKKREPKTMFSTESWHPEKIRENLTNMLPTTQWQLAGGIFASNIAGDESLHIGQFMAIQDNQQNVVGIKRIDLGARERYAIVRSNHPYDPYKTSSQYCASGQFGKDYIDFLLSSEDIKRKYTLLWSLAVIDQNIETQYILSFITAINSVPANQKEQAYLGVLTSINQGATSPLANSSTNLDENIDKLATYLGELAQARAYAMQKFALQDLQKIFKYNEPLMQQFIHAYKNNDFTPINALLVELKQKPPSVENAEIILYICDTALLMSMNKDYQDQQKSYLDTLKEYQIKFAIFKFIRPLLLSKEIIDPAIEHLIHTITEEYDYKCNSWQLADANLWNKLFNYGLQHKDTTIIGKVLEQKLDFTAFGTKDSSTNRRDEKRTEGALLLAAKFNDYNTLSELLDKRSTQFGAQLNTVSHTNKTIGSIDRKDINNENIFHCLFNNWQNIPKQYKQPLLNKLINLLVIEERRLTGGTDRVAAIFSQKNNNDQTPLHIIFKNNMIEAYTCLSMAIQNLPKANMRLWCLGDFIDFSQETKFNKNFLDYAYDTKNKWLLEDLFKEITNARTCSVIDAEQRNALLCSNSSPLDETQKNAVKSKLATGKKHFGFLDRTSGKDSFKNGVTLWLKAIALNQTQDQRSLNQSCNKPDQR